MSFRKITDLGCSDSERKCKLFRYYEEGGDRINHGCLSGFLDVEDLGKVKCAPSPNDNSIIIKNDEKNRKNQIFQKGTFVVIHAKKKREMFNLIFNCLMESGLSVDKFIEKKFPRIIVEKLKYKISHSRIERVIKTAKIMIRILANDQSDTKNTVSNDLNAGYSYVDDISEFLSQKTEINYLQNTGFFEWSGNLEGIDRLRIELSNVIFRKIYTEKMAPEKIQSNLKTLYPYLSKDSLELFNNIAKNPNDFSKFSNDLIELTSLLITSIKSHKIIKADFSVNHYVSYLYSKNITIHLSKKTLYKAMSDIYDNLSKNYPNIFPEKMQQTTNIGPDYIVKVGTRLKIYLARNIYNQKYLGKNDIAQCLNCINDDFEHNTFCPRYYAKDFHHEEYLSEKSLRYNSSQLFSLFQKYRGKPNFLSIIKGIVEKDKVSFKCRSHHQILHADLYNAFKKLISWISIPFKINDIYDLPAEIILILCDVAVENHPITKSKPIRQKIRIRRRIISHLKRRYIIENLMGKKCPICNDFTSKYHLPAFDFNHIFPSSIASEQRKKLYRTIRDRNISEAIDEILVQKGCFICKNCHNVYHQSPETLKLIHNDTEKCKVALKDNIYVKKRVKELLITKNKINENLRDPFDSNFRSFPNLKDYLIAVSMISRSNKKNNGIEKLVKCPECGNIDVYRPRGDKMPNQPRFKCPECGHTIYVKTNIIEGNIPVSVTREEIGNCLGFGKVESFIEDNIQITDKYFNIFPSTNQSVRYSLTEFGDQIADLILYFRDYFSKV